MSKGFSEKSLRSLVLRYVKYRTASPPPLCYEFVFDEVDSKDTFPRLVWKCVLKPCELCSSYGHTFFLNDCYMICFFLKLIREYDRL